MFRTSLAHIYPATTCTRRCMLIHSDHTRKGHCTHSQCLHSAPSHHSSHSVKHRHSQFMSAFSSVPPQQSFRQTHPQSVHVYSQPHPTIAVIPSNTPTVSSGLHSAPFHHSSHSVKHSHITSTFSSIPPQQSFCQTYPVSPYLHSALSHHSSQSIKHTRSPCLHSLIVHQTHPQSMSTFTDSPSNTPAVHVYIH